MDILLLSQNRIIVEFVKIASQRLGAKLEVSREFDSTLEGSFDAVVVDEHFSILPCQELISKIDYKKSILLSSGEKIENNCNYYIKKPFLPNDIVRVLALDSRADEGLDESPILSIKEVESIKSLLDQTDKEPTTSKKEEKISIEPNLFVDTICSIGADKLKEILKGSKITITIDFKGDDQ
jgi:hypothetical protein